MIGIGRPRWRWSWRGVCSDSGYYDQYGRHEQAKRAGETIWCPLCDSLDAVPLVALCKAAAHGAVTGHDAILHDQRFDIAQQGGVRAIRQQLLGTLQMFESGGGIAEREVQLRL